MISLSAFKIYMGQVSYGFYTQENFQKGQCRRHTKVLFDKIHTMIIGKCAYIVMIQNV